MDQDPGGSGSTSPPSTFNIEFDSKTPLANMTLREADVAIRLGLKAPGHLIGSSYAKVGYAVFGGADLVGRLGPDTLYSDYPWVGWDRAVNRSTDAWMNKHAPGATVVMRFGSMPVIAHAVAQGAGLAVLPCVIGDADPRMRRAGAYFQSSELRVWLLTHPKLRGTARIKAFLGFMREALKRDADLFEGSRMPTEHV
jgi:DNA-binding transcriptional LysR family regulator